MQECAPTDAVGINDVVSYRLFPVIVHAVVLAARLMPYEAVDRLKKLYRALLLIVIALFSKVSVPAE